jgi:hypothetical protein
MKSAFSCSQLNVTRTGEESGTPDPYRTNEDLVGCSTVVAPQLHGVATQNRIYLTLKQLVTTNNYETLTELYAPKITVATAHIKSSQSSLAVVW